jgi:hypothetical protein
LLWSINEHENFRLGSDHIYAVGTVFKLVFL